jgi:4-amino-4-deoxy-L-arabinose transferase-like glycosyltransferase
MLLLFFYLALNSLVMDSPTMDEQNHLARGLAFLASGDPRLSLEHPPLVNSLSALPVYLLLDVRLPFDHPSWEQPEGWYAFAEQLLWVYNQDVARMIFLGRLPIVFLTMGLALVGFHFARALWGERRAGLLAAAFLLFDPNVMAHGRYITTDLGGAAFLLLAVWLVWRMWQAPGWSWPRLLWAGFALGLAFGGKLSTIVFGPILILVACLPLAGQPWTRQMVGRRIGQLALAGLLAVAAVWLIFGGQWGPMQFRSQALGWLDGRAGPMPTFWAGIEQILFLSGGGRPSFLLGQFSTEGFVHYFPVAFLAKTPLVALAAMGVAAVALLWRSDTRRQALFLLLPPLIYFALSLNSALNIGYRHLLPMLPFLYLLAAGMGRFLADRRGLDLSKPGVLRQDWGADRGAARKRWETAVWIVPALLLLTSLTIHPHYLSYFNRLAGGPANGYNVLVDSNVDWGQDLLRLQAWMADNEVERVRLAWFGTADPVYYGLAYEPLPGLPRHFDLWWALPFDPQNPPPGVYAISASALWELPLEEKYVFPYFRARPPDDRVGYSILIYRVGR